MQYFFDACFVKYRYIPCRYHLVGQQTSSCCQLPSSRVGLVVKREASASVAGVQQLIGTFTENQEKQSWSPKTKLEPQSPGEGKRNKKKRL